MPGDLQEEVSRLCDLLAGRRSDPPGLEGPDTNLWYTWIMAIEG